MTDRGHNNPPEMIDLAKETTRQISEWFAENPTVTEDKEAKEIKLHIDRAKLCLKDLEAARDSKVRPLNEQVAAINTAHRVVRNPLGSVLDSMLEALDVYVKTEEKKRLAAAEEARRIAREAEEKAREAERIEREGLENVQVGEVGIDVAALTEEADVAFMEFEKAERTAIRAQEQAHVRVAGGFSRSIGLRDKEILDVVDPAAVIQDLGNPLPENVRQAVLTAARAFRRINGRLPNGISATKERYVG